MPSKIDLYQIGVWFCVGFFTGAGWAIAAWLVGRIFSAIRIKGKLAYTVALTKPFLIIDINPFSRPDTLSVFLRAAAVCIGAIKEEVGKSRSGFVGLGA